MTIAFSSPPAISATRKPILVIDPALHTCELDCFNEIVRRAPINSDFRYFAPARFGLDDLVSTRERPAGIIILGSSASVYDGLDWQTNFNAWLLEQMKNGVPTLGICYGHQLIAHLFGGKIDLGFNGDKKKGCRDIVLASTCKLQAAHTSGSTIVSHREVVVDAGSLQVVASSADVLIEAIQHPSLPIWGFQPHIEATEAFLRNNQIPLDYPEHDPEFGYDLINAFVDIAQNKSVIE